MTKHKHNKAARVAVILSLCLVAACTNSHPTAEAPPSKDQARAIGGSADGLDLCEIWDWYGDGICDDFCVMPDTDCAEPPTECREDSECDEGQTCVPGDFCDHSCAAGDPSCCVGNTCVGATPEPEECLADSDCPGAQVCVPGDFCFHWCAAGDPACCRGNTCEMPTGGTEPEPEPENECVADSECESGDCIPGDFCFYWCAAGDPACCVGNTCG